MTRHGRWCLGTAAGLALWGLTAAQETPKPRPISLELRTGVEYDSNVAALEIDASSGQGDVAALLGAHLGLESDPGRRLKLNAAYDFSQSVHREFEAFDLRIHMGSAGLGYDFGPVTAGMTYQLAQAALGGEEYLVLKQASPYLSRLLGKRLYFRLGWIRSDKEFTTAPERNGIAQGPNLDTFVFLNGVKRYLTLGYERTDEDAADDTLDYSGVKIKGQITHRIRWSSREMTLRAGLRHESRSYRQAGLLEPRREDARDRLDAEAEWPVWGHALLRARYEYASNRSNLASVNFDEHVASITLGLRH
jgi:hypothetical protein